MDKSRPSVLLPAVDPGLEMSGSDFFWEAHWKKFAWGLAAVALLILAVGAFMLRQSHVRTAAESLYAAASGPDAWRGVIEKFPGSLVAGNAQLQLANALRSEGKFDDAASELGAMLASQPDHPLAGAAWLALGEIRQAQNNTAAALEAFRTCSAGQAASYAAPLAMLAEAKLLLSAGSRGEALAVLESVGTAYPETPAAMVAAAQLASLKPPATGPALPAGRK